MIIREERDLGCVSISSTQVSGAVVLSEGWLGRFSYPLCYLPSCSSQGLEGRGDPHFQSRIPESPVSLLESHCPGDPSVEVWRPDAQVSLLLWDISKHFPLTDNTLSKEQQPDTVPCRSEPQSQVQILGGLLGPGHPPQGSLFCLTVCLPRDSITCVHVSGSTLSP